MTDMYMKSFTDFINMITHYTHNSPSGQQWKLYLKQWEFDLFMEHHLLDKFPADRIVIIPDMFMG